MTRGWFSPKFTQANGVGRLGSLSATLGAGSLVQFFGVLTGFLTVPIIVTELGSSGYGVLVVIVSMAPWLTLVDGALHPTVRLLVGESRIDGAPVAPTSLVRSAIALALKIVGLNLATLIVGLLVLPLVALFGSAGVVDSRELVVAIVCFALPIVASGPGAVYLGALEGVGRTVVASVLTGIGPLVALPLTLVVAGAGGGLAPLCAVQGVSVALPRLCAWGYWVARPSLDKSDPSVGPRVRGRLVMQMLLLSVAFLVQTGFDPVIVSSHLGADAAGAFGLANRIVMGALIPIMVLTPLFSANLAAARRAGWSERSNQDLGHLVAQATGGGIFVGGCVVALGPLVARVLGAGQVETPFSLYLAGGTYVLAGFVSTPLMLAFSGPQGLRRSVRLSIVLLTGNVVLSIVWVDELGPAGPLWASALATSLGAAYWFLMWARHPEWLGETHPNDVAATD